MTNLSWGEVVKQYSEQSELHNARGTRVREERVLTVFRAFLSMTPLNGPECLICGIDFRTLEAYQAWRTKDAARATCNTEIRHLSTIFNWAVERGHLAENPCKRLKVLSVVDREPTVLKESEIQRLADALLESPRTMNYGRAVLLVANSGVRAGEGFWSKARDVDFHDGPNENMAALYIRSRPEYPIKRKRERRIPLNSVATKIAEQLVVEAGGPDAYLFRTRTGRRFDTMSALHVIQRMSDKLGIRNVSWQAIRRTFSTRIVPFYSEVGYSQLMGHSIRTGRQWYIAGTRVNLAPPPTVGAFKSTGT